MDAAAPAYERFRLVGDEDTGVGLDCRDCDRGGAPIAYLPGIPGDDYPNGHGVIVVETISGLLAAADEHDQTVHGGR